MVAPTGTPSHNDIFLKMHSLNRLTLRMEILEKLSNEIKCKVG